MNQASVNNWIAKAEGDLKTGKDELKTKKPVVDAVCFHMQQCVEKYLKAFLVFRNREFRRTHDLSELIQRCAELDPEFSQLFELDADRLTEYAVEVRYPGDMILPSLRDAHQSVTIAEQVKKFVSRKLEKLGLKKNLTKARKSA